MGFIRKIFGWCVNKFQLCRPILVFCKCFFYLRQGCFYLHPMIIMHVVNIFSLSVSAATFPKPTLVMQVMVKQRAVTYIVLRLGPLTSSGELLWFDHTYAYGLCVTFASFHNQLYCTPLSASDRPIEYQMQASQ